MLERVKSKESAVADLSEEQFQIPPGKFVFSHLVYLNNNKNG